MGGSLLIASRQSLLRSLFVFAKGIGMDIEKIKKLIELIQESGVAEIEIREGEDSVRIAREFKPSATQTFIPSSVMNGSTVGQTSLTEMGSAQVQPQIKSADKKYVHAPMVGTVYLSPSPSTPAFIEIGQIVKKGDVVCLIEAMKMFNQVEADCSGKIVSRLVDNGTPVEFNQPLFTIEEEIN